jgi:16S rRNA (uracil1498-N3)-methyltransferase
MRRYWIETEQIDLTNRTVQLDGEIFHHIFDVCRQQKGSKFEVIVSGKAYFVQVTEVSRKTAVAEILEERILSPLPHPPIKLALCIPRFPVLEAILEKSVEMGIHTVQLLSSDYSFIKSSEKISEGKWDRWKKIIVSGTQQSGRGELMTLSGPRPLRHFVQELDPQSKSLCLFGYEGDAVMTLKEYLRPQAARDWSEAWVIVGGEGGFSSQEAEDLKNQGIQSVTLGEQILRVETACITLVSILKYELGLMRKEK